MGLTLDRHDARVVLSSQSSSSTSLFVQQTPPSRHHHAAKLLCMRRSLASPDGPAICPLMAAFLAALNGPQSCMTCSQCKTALKVDGCRGRRCIPAEAPSRFKRWNSIVGSNQEQSHLLACEDALKGSSRYAACIRIGKPTSPRHGRYLTPRVSPRKCSGCMSTRYLCLYTVLLFKQQTASPDNNALLDLRRGCFMCSSMRVSTRNYRLNASKLSCPAHRSQPGFITHRSRSTGLQPGQQDNQAFSPAARPEKSRRLNGIFTDTLACTEYIKAGAVGNQFLCLDLYRHARLTEYLFSFSFCSTARQCAPTCGVEPPAVIRHAKSDDGEVDEDLSTALPISAAQPLSGCLLACIQDYQAVVSLLFLSFSLARVT